ncbi:MAG TPA: hypothetical protein VLA16_13400, partial [Ideonella sp.]|nr:hypothetical protein [Ideonella sp.]
MSLKNLSESEWKKFSKARDLKDAPLLKALVALDKAEKAPPGEQLKALDELEKQADALLKAHKADKEVAAYLAELDKSLKAQRKTSEQAAKAHAESAQAESEDEDSPALLTTKMVPLMRAVPKGEVLHALVAMAGKGTVVMVARKPIPVGRRKLLAAELGVSGGIKYHAGQCLFEAKAHTFVMETVVAGLAKKIKQALLDQTEQRYKVRVRGDDPALVDDDGDEAEGDDGGSPAAVAPAVAAIPPAPPLPPTA